MQSLNSQNSIYLGVNLTSNKDLNAVVEGMSMPLVGEAWLVVKLLEFGAGRSPLLS